MSKKRLWTLLPSTLALAIGGLALFAIRASALPLVYHESTARSVSARIAANKGIIQSALTQHPNYDTGAVAALWTRLQALSAAASSAAAHAPAGGSTPPLTPPPDPGEELATAPKKESLFAFAKQSMLAAVARTSTSATLRTQATAQEKYVGRVQEEGVLSLTDETEILRIQGEIFHQLRLDAQKAENPPATGRQGGTVPFTTPSQPAPTLVPSLPAPPPGWQNAHLPNPPSPAGAASGVSF